MCVDICYNNNICCRDDTRIAAGQGTKKGEDVEREMKNRTRPMTRAAAVCVLFVDASAAILKEGVSVDTHTHTHGRAHAQTHTHTHTYTLVRARAAAALPQGFLPARMRNDQISLPPTGRPIPTDRPTERPPARQRIQGVPRVNMVITAAACRVGVIINNII